MGCILFYKNQVQGMLLVITPTTAGKSGAGNVVSDNTNNGVKFKKLF
jgi:hypothetical protein